MHIALSASHLGTDLGGRYRLERLIGEGVSSWVFAATDLLLERHVAVKLLRRRAEPEHAAQRQRFVQEGRMLAKLAHPHVIAVHDAGETPEGDGYLVMELSQAGTLDGELSRRSVIALDELLALILPLLGALACAHDRGIIHRDLKPANIALVRHEGAKTRAKLLDFGIARASGQGMSSAGLVGTPAYMAPEQARAEPCGPSADVWAMGVVLFRCLSGTLPFEASSSAAMLLKIVQGRATRVAAVCPDLPPRVAVALDRALEPDPAHRYPDMRTFARVLGVACRQDGVHIDMNPEPLGLPDFGAWLERADMETTRRKAHTGDPGALEAARPEVAQPARAEARHGTPAAVGSPAGRSRRTTAFWALASLVGLATVLWTARGQNVATRGRLVPVRAAPMPTLDQPVPGSGQRMSTRGQSMPAPGQVLLTGSLECGQASPPSTMLHGGPALQPNCDARPPDLGFVVPAFAQPAPNQVDAPAPRRSRPAARAPRIEPRSQRASPPPPVLTESASPEPAQVPLITNWEW